MPTAARKHVPHRTTARTHNPSRAHKRQVYTSSRWIRERRLFLQQHPLCIDCESRGRVTPANTVDHRLPHNGPDDPLAWDWDNWQSLCGRCHSRKTRRDQGRGADILQTPQSS